MSTRTWASRFLTTRRSSSGTARRSPGGGSSPATSSSSTIFITPGSTSVTGASSTPGGAAAASWSRGSTSRGTGPAGSEVADSDTRRARALDVQVGGLDAPDARAEHVLPRLRERPVGVDPARGVLDHVGGESRLPRVHRRPRDAEVGGEPDEEPLLEAGFAQIAHEAGRRLAVRFVERGVGVDGFAVALADDQLGVRDLELLDELGIGRPLYAVVRPEHLGTVPEADRLERLLAGVGRGERGVAGRVPVLREDDVREAPRDPVDERDDRVAFLDGQCPAGHEAVLDVDDEEDVGRRRLELPPRGLGERRGCAGGQLGDDQSGRSLLEELAPIACLHGTKTPFPVVWVSKSR